MADNPSETKRQAASIIEVGIDRAAELAYTTMVRRINPSPDWAICGWKAQPEKLRADWRASIRAIIEYGQKPKVFRGTPLITAIAALQNETKRQAASIIEVLNRAILDTPADAELSASIAPMWVAAIVERLERAGYRIVPQAEIMEQTVLRCEEHGAIYPAGGRCGLCAEKER